MFKAALVVWRNGFERWQVWSEVEVRIYIQCI